MAVHNLALLAYRYHRTPVRIPRAGTEGAFDLGRLISTKPHRLIVGTMLIGTILVGTMLNTAAALNDGTAGHYARQLIEY